MTLKVEQNGMALDPAGGHLIFGGGIEHGDNGARTVFSNVLSGQRDVAVAVAVSGNLQDRVDVSIDGQSFTKAVGQKHAAALGSVSPGSGVTVKITGNNSGAFYSVAILGN
jgi:hypothetical protein